MSLCSFLSIPYVARRSHVPSEVEGPALSEVEGPALSEVEGFALSEVEGPALNKPSCENTFIPVALVFSKQQWRM